MSRDFLAVLNVRDMASKPNFIFVWLTRSIYRYIMVSLDLFIYLFVYESRAPVTWSTVDGELVVLVVCKLGSSNFFQMIVSRVSSPPKPTDTDPANVISADCARPCTLLRWLKIRYGLYCFGFHGCIVVYPVPHKFALRRKLIIRTLWFVHISLGWYKHVPHAIGQGFGIG